LTRARPRRPVPPNWMMTLPFREIAVVDIGGGEGKGLEFMWQSIEDQSRHAGEGGGARHLKRSLWIGCKGDTA
jgi:hypothetical protein